MKNAVVIDFFTRKPLPKPKQNEVCVNHYVEEHGVYLGCLLSKDSELLKSILKQIKLKNEQITLLSTDLLSLQQDYQEVLEYCLEYLGKNNPEVKKVNVENDDFL